MKPIFVIVGPTAVGKTKLSLAIAKEYDGELISTDAFQFYRGLNIGTAKASREEQSIAKHHLLDILDPTASFSVADYQRIVRNVIDDVLSRGKSPILVGGSGLYLQAALYDYHFEGEARDSKKEELLESTSTEDLYHQLQEQHPHMAEKIHPNNRRRILRALTIGEEIDEDFLADGKKLLYEPVLWIGLTMPRAKLYERIEARVDNMFEQGLVEEARQLYNLHMPLQSAQAIGYKELFPYFRGEYTLVDAKDLIKRNTRRYAKRQWTWFQNQLAIPWYDIDPEQEERCFQEILEDLKKRVQK